MGTLDTAKPFCRLEIFEPEATEPKFVISPNIFLDTEKPSDDNQASSDIYLTNLNINSQLHGSVNICELTIKHNPGNAPAIAMESKVKVYLGYYQEDYSQGAEYSLVFTGHVTRVNVQLQKTELECRSDIYKLSSLRKKIAFSTQLTINEIIQKLAIDEGGLELASNGIAQSQITKQPGFSISEQKAILDHLKLMSDYSGLNIYSDVNDKFHAGDWVEGDLKDRSNQQDKEWLSSRGKDESSSSDLYKHVFTFGKDLIACDFELSRGKASSVEIFGFKPFSDDTVHTIDPPKVEFTPSNGGDTDLPKKVFKLSHITREDAEKIAENLYYRINRQLIGKIKVLGSPQVRLGDGAMIQGDIYDKQPFENLDFTDDSGNKSDLDKKVFQVAKVNHRFNDAEGFVTRLEFVEGRSAAGTEATAAGEGAAGAGVGAGAGAETEFGGVAGEGAAEGLVTIKGTLKDPDGNILSNVEYSLVTPSGETLTGVTDAKGEVRYDDMPKGHYRIFYPKNMVKNESGDWVRVEGDEEEASLDFDV